MLPDLISSVDFVSSSFQQEFTVTVKLLCEQHPLVLVKVCKKILPPSIKKLMINKRMPPTRHSFSNDNLNLHRYSRLTLNPVLLQKNVPDPDDVLRSRSHGLFRKKQLTSVHIGCQTDQKN